MFAPHEFPQSCDVFVTADKERCALVQFVGLQIHDRLLAVGGGASGLLDSLIATMNGAAPVTAQEGY